MQYLIAFKPVTPVKDYEYFKNKTEKCVGLYRVYERNVYFSIFFTIEYFC